MSSEVGRPSKFKPEYTQALLDYFSVEPYEERMKRIVTKDGDVIEIPEDVANDFPTLAGFACQIGVHRDTLHEWTQQDADFSDAYKMAKQYQERFLATNGLKGLVNTAFGIFTAKNVIGWRDKQDVELTGKDGGAIQSESTVKHTDLEDRIKAQKGEAE